MKRIIHPLIFLLLSLLLLHATKSNAQACAVGFTRDTINWDYLDFLPNTGSYIAPTPYINLAQSQTQRFLFGSTQGGNSVTITHDYTGANDPGENITNTGETGSFGKGSDVQFIGNGQITVAFATAVSNINFSIYDIDRNQDVTITAFGPAPTFTAINVGVVRLNAAFLALSCTPCLAPVVNSGNTSYATNSSTDGTINVSIAGPAARFVITVTNTNTNLPTEDGSFWLSDISACYNGTFTPNYYYPSRPFTNQSSYVLTCRNDSIYYTSVTAATGGKSKFLFADYGHDRINSVAYDPVRHMVYYSYSLSGPGGTASSTDYKLRRYDYNMDTLGVVCNDIRTLGVRYMIRVSSPELRHFMMGHYTWV